MVESINMFKYFLFQEQLTELQALMSGDWSGFMNGDWSGFMSGDWSGLFKV